MNASNICNISAQLSAFHDGELPIEQSQEVEAHLLECPECAAELASLRRFSGVLRAAELPVGPPMSHWEDLPARLAADPSLADGVDDLADQEDDQRDRMRTQPRQPKHLRYVRWLSGAAAAVFVLAAGRVAYDKMNTSSDPTNGSGVDKTATSNPSTQPVPVKPVSAIE